MRRRANDEGTYKQLPSGKVRLVKRINGDRVYGPAGRTKLEARANFAAMLEERNRPPAPPDLKLATFFNAQVTRLKPQLSPSTYALYETIYENFINNHPIGGVDVPTLSTADVEAWIEQFTGKAPRTIARYLQCLKAILEHAVRLGLVDKNPATPVRPPRIEEHPKDLLNRKQVDALLKLETTTRMRTGILLCLHGLRRAEACGLKYEDFDGEGITVRRQALEVNGELIIKESTKTGDRRWIPVDTELKKILSEGKGWVLATSTGTPLRPRNMAREWSTISKGTQFETLTLHDLRSTFGMLMLEKGVDVRTAAELMGHSPAMLAKIYARSRKELKQAAMGLVYGYNGGTDGGTNQEMAASGT